MKKKTTLFLRLMDPFSFGDVYNQHKLNIWRNDFSCTCVECTPTNFIYKFI